MAQRHAFGFGLAVSALALAMIARGAPAMIVLDGPVESSTMVHPRIAIPALETLEHSVSVTIRDQVATTTVEQVYYNPSSSNVEGTFLFPLPRGAHIEKFSMDINGQDVQAELLDADKARKIYEDIVRKLRDPALLEYAGAGLVKYRIFPIEGKSKKHVTLRYTQVLNSDSGLVTYTYPLNTDKFNAKPIKTVAVKLTLDSKQAIKSVYSPTHDVEIARQDDHHVTVGYETNDARPDLDFQLIYGVEQADAAIGVDLMTYNDPADAHDGGYFLLLASPGALGKNHEVIRKDVVFVVDTSGSMAGPKLDQARGAMNYCIASLNEGDHFQIVRFSTEAEPLFPDLVDAGKENRDRALAFVEGFRATGGTAIEAALVEAVKPAALRADTARPYTVIFLTDGLPTVGTRDEDAIISSVTKKIGQSNVRVFSFGVGLDVNTHLLDKLTEKTRAFSQYVLPSEDIEVKVSSFFTRISEPVLAEVELVIDGEVRLSKVHPRPLPDVFVGDQLIVLGRFEGQGKATLTLAGKVNGRRQTFTHEADFGGEAHEHPFIARLWATRRVGYLLDEIRLHSDNQELRDEVAQLARRHGIVTPYTSYLILEDEQTRGVEMARRSLQEMAAPAVTATAGESFARMKEDRSGEAGVAGAAVNQELKSAANLQANRYALDYADVDRGNRAVMQQNVKVVQGRAFYQNGEQWVDARVAEQPKAEIVRVKFDSPEYYDLIARHPEAANWLSVGRNVQVLLGGTIYEIGEES